MNSQNGHDRGPNGNIRSHGTQALFVLTKLLKNIIVPLEKQKSDNIMATIKKFASNIDQTIQQVTGSVSIRLPDPDNLSDTEAIMNKELMIEYQSLLVNWLIFFSNVFKIFWIEWMDSENQGHYWCWKQEKTRAKLRFGRNRILEK